MAHRIWRPAAAALVLALVAGCVTPVEHQAAMIDMLSAGDRLYAAGDYAGAHGYYREGIPTIREEFETGGGQQLTSHGMRFESDDAKAKDADFVGPVSIDSTGEECFFKAMSCLVALGKYNQAVGQFERYLKYFPNYRGIDATVNDIKRIIEAYRDEGDAEGLIRACGLLVVIDAFNRDGRDAQFVIAGYHFKRGASGPAIGGYQDILAFFPDDPRIPDVLFRLGLLHYDLYRGVFYDGKILDQSEGYFRRCLERGSGDAERRFETGRYLAAINDHKAAKVYFKGAFYQRRGNPAAARGYFEELCARYRTTAWAVKAAAELVRLPAATEAPRP
ncbi:MAG: tetratricopeptide repeat protein [Planctomycetota bacterium]